LSSFAANPAESQPSLADPHDDQSDHPKLGLSARYATVAALSIAVATAIIFARAVTCGFLNLDDFAYVTENRHVKMGLAPETLRWLLTAEVAANWHPLTMLSHAADVQIFGLWPAGHHLTSVLLHAANSGLLFWVLFRMTGNLTASALAAVLFAWHPLRVESVAWVSERKDVLSTFFWFAATCSYLRYVEGRQARWYGLTMLLFALGLMAKPMLVTLPCTLLLLDYWPLGRFSATKQTSGPTAGWHRLIIEKLPLLAIAATSSGITLYYQRSVGAVRNLELVPWSVRLANSVVAYADYLWQTIWPTGLVVYYPHPGSGLSAARIVVAVLVIGGITALVLWQLRARPYLAVGWFWFLGTLVPVIGLVQVGDQARADRYTYVPSVGLSIMVAWSVAQWLNRASRWRSAIVSLVAIWVLVLAALAWRQIGFWQTPETLFRHALAAGPRPAENWLAHYCLAEALYNRGELEEAERHVDQSIRANPELDKPYFKKGEIRLAQGDFQGAAAEFARALRTLNPKRRVAAHNNLAHCLVELGQADEAAEHYRRALSIQPANVDVRLGLIRARLVQREFADAAVVARTGLELVPSSPQLTERLAWILATAPDASLRDGPQAERLARRACELTDYRLPRMLDTLAAAYAEMGQFDEALDWATRALLIVEAMEPEPTPAAERFAEGVRQRIERYQRRRPFRMTRRAEGHLHLSEIVEGRQTVGQTKADGVRTRSVQVALSIAYS